MEVLKFIAILRARIALGRPLRNVIEDYLLENAKHDDTDLHKQLQRVLGGEKVSNDLQGLRRRLIALIEMGFEGIPLSRRLEDLERDLHAQADHDLAHHQARLPQILSIPMFLCLLPSYFLLIFSIIYQNLSEVF